VYPNSDGGRFVAIVGGLMGTLMTAVTIALTTNYLDLSRSESKVVAFLKKYDNKQLVEGQAARTIESVFILWASSNTRAYPATYKSLLSNPKQAETLLYDNLRKFRDVKRSVGIHHKTRRCSVLISLFRVIRYVQTNDGTDPVDRQLTLLETMEVNLGEVSTNMKAMEAHLLGPVLAGADGGNLDVAQQVAQLKHTLDNHIAATNSRLAALESAAAAT
jgi:hypothetical protein